MQSPSKKKQFEFNFKYKKNLLFLIFPIIFGLWSYLLGQDRNSDLINYHLYNAFAFINNDQNDFGVAGLQGFFNPIIDLPYYYFIHNLKPQLVSFIFGVIHGLIFVVVFKIAEKLIPNAHKKILIFIIAISACLTPNFLAGLGNSMGDNLTALLNLISILILLTITEKKRNFLILISGLIIGMSVGLKLTNAPYAAASIIFILEKNTKNLTEKIILLLRYSIFILIGILITGGFWYFKMWVQYQNPFFPLLYSIFPSNHFTSDPFLFGAVTKTFGPKNIFDYIFWPFLTCFNYARYGRGLIHQILWPTIYLLGAYIIYAHKNWVTSKIKNILTPQNCLIFFVILGYVLNFTIFKIQRYSVTVETLSPLVIFLLLSKVFSKTTSYIIFKRFSVISILIIMLGGFGTYGHTNYREPAFDAEKFTFPQNNKTLVIIPDYFSPVSWVVTLYDPSIKFYRSGLFLDSQNELKKILHNNDYDTYIMLSGFYNWRIENINKWNSILNRLGVLSSSDNCNMLDKFIKKVHFRGVVEFNKNGGNQNICALNLHKKDMINSDEVHTSLINTNKSKLSLEGIYMNESSCKILKAWSGSKQWRYIICKAETKSLSRAQTTN